MKVKITVLVLFAMGLTLNSCKNNNSSDDIEIDKVIRENKDDLDSEANVDIKFRDSLENFILTDYLDERDLRRISNDQRRFQYQKIDLNNDGKSEIFINFITPYFCDSQGCDMLLLSNDFKLITHFTSISTPIYIEENLQHHWKSLVVKSEGSWRKLFYDQGSYPSNPTLNPISKDSISKSVTVLFEKSDRIKTFTF